MLIQIFLNLPVKEVRPFSRRARDAMTPAGDSLGEPACRQKEKRNMRENDLSGFLDRVIEDDCLNVMPQLPDKSIDMILCDLPYGTTQNKWDSVIDLKRLWAEYVRIIKDNGAIILTSQGVFTARLILSNEEWFRYKIVWIKSKSTNFLNAKKQPLRKHEDICVFYKQQPTYHPQMAPGESYDKGMRKAQFTGSYGDFQACRVKSDGQRYPNDVLCMEEQDLPVEDFLYIKTAESEGPVYHPTQKPVELGRYLIRTFTNPGEVVLDNACGSGSFLVAAALEGRRYIGIEKNENAWLHKVRQTDYIKVCMERLAEAEQKRRRLTAEPVLPGLFDGGGYSLTAK